MPIRKIKNPYNFETCRACSHYYLGHTNSSGERDACIFGFTLCPCKEFLPKDNLEFLEYKYEKSSLRVLSFETRS